MGSFCLIGIEFRFCRMKSVLWVDGGNGCTTVRAFLMLLSCTLKNGLNGKLYVMSILLQLKKQRAYGCRISVLHRCEITVILKVRVRSNFSGALPAYFMA